MGSEMCIRDSFKCIYRVAQYRPEALVEQAGIDVVGEDVWLVDDGAVRTLDLREVATYIDAITYLLVGKDRTIEHDREVAARGLGDYLAMVPSRGCIVGEEGDKHQRQD